MIFKEPDPKQANLEPIELLIHYNRNIIYPLLIKSVLIMAGVFLGINYLSKTLIIKNTLFSDKEVFKHSGNLWKVANLCI